jgi:hypothetical protein
MGGRGVAKYRATPPVLWFCGAPPALSQQRTSTTCRIKAQLKRLGRTWLLGESFRAAVGGVYVGVFGGSYRTASRLNSNAWATHGSGEALLGYIGCSQRCGGKKLPLQRLLLTISSCSTLFCGVGHALSGGRVVVITSCKTDEQRH